MYLCQIQQLKHLSSKEYIALKELCHLAKNLYNVGLYNVRQHYFSTKNYLSYNENYHQSKSNENYKALNSNIGQQILKEVDGVFKSFFGLIKLAKEGKYDYKAIKLPRYLEKDGYFTLVIGQIRIKPNGVLDIPMSPSFKRKYGKVSVKIPSNLMDKTIKEIRIIPKYNARFFEIQYTYEVIEEQRKLNKQHVLAVDLGVSNLATCVTNKGKSFIVDGKKLKSINQWYNKRLAKLQSIKDKQFGTKNKIVTYQQAVITRKRNNHVRDYLNKTARMIINYCLKNDIGNLVIGYNPEIQKNINIGKKNNQTFVNIPTGELVNKLQYLSERYGICFHKQEESYTSKASFFDNDEIPIYDANDTKTYSFSGKRISRGQYKTAKGIIINADVNGALNILKKSSLGGSELTTLQSRGNLDMPLRIRVA